MSKIRTITTEEYDRIIEKFKNGEPLTRKENIFYNSNINLKRKGIHILMTRQEQDEYIKCAIDVIYFAEKYLDIKLRKYQKKWLKNLQKRRHLIIFNSRQTGSSTIIAIFQLWKSLFNNINLLTLCSKSYLAEGHIKRISEFYQKLPFWLKLGIKCMNKTSIQFTISKIYARVAKESSLEGFTYDHITMLDFGYMPESTYKTLLPTLAISSGDPKSQLVIQSSTSNETFKKLVIDAERKKGDPSKNSFKCIRTYWWEVDGREGEWERNMILDIGKDMFSREFDLQL